MSSEKLEAMMHDQRGFVRLEEINRPDTLLWLPIYCKALLLATTWIMWRK